MKKKFKTTKEILEEVNRSASVLRKTVADAKGVGVEENKIVKAENSLRKSRMTLKNVEGELAYNNKRLRNQINIKGGEK